MGTSRVCPNSLDLKRYLLTPASCPKPKTPVSSTNRDAWSLPTPVSSTNRDACSVPTPNVVHVKSNLHVNNDELDKTANVITSSFNKRRRFTLIKLYSSESVNIGDKYVDCSVANLLYLDNSCETSCGSLVKTQVSPVCDMDLKNVKLLRCEHMGGEQCLFARKEKINNRFKGNASNSFENEGGVQKTFYTSKNVEQNGTPVPPSLRKMGINKSSENKSHGQKRKKYDDNTSTRSVAGHETHEKGDSSCPLAPQRKKARTRNQNKDSNRDILTDFSSSLNYHDNDHRLINRCETHITKTRTCMDTTSITNFNGCERFQKEGSVSEIKLSLNSNPLQLCELRQKNDATKRPIMGKTAKFASMDSLSLDVLTEIKRKVHIKYGDKKRRRVKTNGILTSAVVCRSRATNGILNSTPESRPTVTNGILKSAVVSSPTTKYGILKSGVVSRLAIKDKRAVFRWIGTCKKLIGFKKKISLMKKNYNSISCM